MERSHSFVPAQTEAPAAPGPEAETEAPGGAPTTTNGDSPTGEADGVGAPDRLRQTMVDLLRAGLSEGGLSDGGMDGALLDVVAQPGRDLWVRVRTDAWLRAGGRWGWGTSVFGVARKPNE